MTMYDMYACLRNELNTRHSSSIIYKNEIVQVTALVMVLEDGDPMLEARYEAERTPKPVAPAITKRASVYNRKEIAEKAHYYAKANTGGTYHKRFGVGMQKAWTAAKAPGIVVPALSTQIEVALKPVKIPAPISYPSLFDYDILYYNPAHYVHYTEPKYFNSTRNHTLHY